MVKAPRKHSPIKGYGSLGNGENCAAYAGARGSSLIGAVARPAERVIFSRHWAPSAYKSPTLSLRAPCRQWVPLNPPSLPPCPGSTSQVAREITRIVSARCIGYIARRKGKTRKNDARSRKLMHRDVTQHDARQARANRLR